MSKKTYNGNRCLALKRDKDICQDCGKKPKSPHVHHEDFNETNHNLFNLVTLCPSCHRKRHGKKAVCRTPNLVHCDQLSEAERISAIRKRLNKQMLKFGRTTEDKNG